VRAHAAAHHAPDAPRAVARSGSRG
jgi:hypothetical protein